MARFVAGGMAVAAPANNIIEPSPKLMSGPASFTPGAALVGVAMEGGCNVAILAGLAVIPLVVFAGLHADPDASFVTPERAASLSLALNDIGRWIRLI